MPLTKFIIYTTVGSAGYNSVLVLLGYTLGSQWDNVGQYSNYINYAIIAAIAAVIIAFVAKRARR
jgi:membrane protein DedA with SNARE-associated domain